MKTGNARSFALKPCYDCKKSYRRLRKHQNKLYCYNCHLSYVTIIMVPKFKLIELQGGLNENGKRS